MKTITIIPTSSRNYDATIDGEVTGSLIYPKWYSTNPQIWLGKDGPYVFKAQNFWHTRHVLAKGGKPVLDMLSKWSATTVITPHKEQHRHFIFKTKSTFSGKYILASHKGEALLEVHSDFSWKKFSQGYTITCNDDFGDSVEEQLLMLLSLHYFRIMQSAAASMGTTT